MGFVWDWGSLNWFAILVALVASMAIPSIWYMKPVFGRWWMADVGMTDEKMQQLGYKIFVVPVFAGFVQAVALALLVMNIGGGAAEGLLVGAAVGLGITALQIIPHYTFAAQPMRLAIINGSQSAATLSVMGLVLGAWR